MHKALYVCLMKVDVMLLQCQLHPCTSRDHSCASCPQIKRRLEQQRQEVLRSKQELAREHEQVAALEVLSALHLLPCTPSLHA